MENQKHNKNISIPETNLNKWNNRLDENMESPDKNNELADKKAKDFSEKFNKTENNEAI